MSNFNYKKWVTENKYGKPLFEQSGSASTGSASTGSASTGSASTGSGNPSGATCADITYQGVDPTTCCDIPGNSGSPCALIDGQVPDSSAIGTYVTFQYQNYPSQTLRITGVTPTTGTPNIDHPSDPGCNTQGCTGGNTPTGSASSGSASSGSASSGSASTGSASTGSASTGNTTGSAPINVPKPKPKPKPKRAPKGEKDKQLREVKRIIQKLILKKNK